jgi:uncharacterized membrane protein
MHSDTDWMLRPTMTVWVYDSPMGAAAGKVRLDRLCHRGSVTVEDAVTVTWVRGAHRPRIGPLRSETTGGATRGSTIGALLDHLLFPSAEDDGVSLLASQLRGTGLDAAFLDEIKQALVPDSSALLVLSSGADLDAVRAVIERGAVRGDVRLLHAYLTTGALETLEQLGRPGPSVEN